MGKYFGTDGFRGEANKELTAVHAFKVGRFLGYWFSNINPDKKSKVVIGKDTRRSSYMFEYALASGIAASGADAYLLHVTTTPSVSFVVRTEDFDCGIMISASHNPFYDNGIKLLNCKGEKLEEEVIEKIEEYLDSDVDYIPLATGENIGCTVDYFAGRNRYVAYLITLATRSYRNVKVGLDTSNGSAWMIAKNVFDTLGAKTHVINNQPDGTNINKDCGSTHIEVLAKYVKENGLDVGFAFDGDADRCIAVDGNGRIIDGDIIMYIFARYMKANGTLANNTVVTAVMSNLGLYKALDELGINYVQTDVGDKYVYECMVKNGHCLGGEQSGHIILSKYAATGDGLITAIKLMEVILKSKISLAELAKDIKIYPQITKNVRVDDKDAVLSDALVLEARDNVAKELGSDGRILLRKSGTEPVVRIMVEAKTEKDCRDCIDKVYRAMVVRKLVKQ